MTFFFTSQWIRNSRIRPWRPVSINQSVIPFRADGCVIARKCLELFFSSSCHRTVLARRTGGHWPVVFSPRTSWTQERCTKSDLRYKRHPNCLVLSSTKHPPEVFDLASSQNGTNLLRERLGSKSISREVHTGAAAPKSSVYEGGYTDNILQSCPRLWCTIKEKLRNNREGSSNFQ